MATDYERMYCKKYNRPLGENLCWEFIAEVMETEHFDGTVYNFNLHVDEPGLADMNALMDEYQVTDDKEFYDAYLFALLHLNEIFTKT